MSASDAMAPALSAFSGRNGDDSSTIHAAERDGTLIESGANLITELIAGSGKVEKKLLEHFKRLKIETLKS